MEDIPSAQPKALGVACERLISVSVRAPFFGNGDCALVAARMTLSCQSASSCALVFMRSAGRSSRCSFGAIFVGVSCCVCLGVMVFVLAV